MNETELKQHESSKQLIAQRKKQVWLIALAMLAGGCLVTVILLAVLYFLFTKVLTIP